MKKNIIVVFGGKSSEHDISILSSVQVLENIDKQKYNVFPIYITKSGEWLLGQKLFDINSFKNFSTKNLKSVCIIPYSKNLFIKTINHYKKSFIVDCAVIVMHGMNGEDGTIQGLFELANIPYTSSSVLGSSIGMEKVLQKKVYESIGVNTVPYINILKNSEENIVTKLKQAELKYPVIVKPNKLGSSIGISVCKNKMELEKALELVFTLDDMAVIEKFIKNRKEINISVLGYKTDIELSDIEEPITTHNFLDFNDKYISGGKSKNKINVRKLKNDNNSFDNKKHNIESKIMNERHKLQKNNENFNKKVINNKDNKETEIFNYYKEKDKLTESCCVKNCGVESEDDGNTLGKTKLNGMQNLGRIFPAKLEKEQIEIINDYAKKIFINLRCKGVVRIDFIIDKDENEIYANEINTIPGSLAYYLWKYKNINFQNLIDKIIDIAIKDNQDKKEITYTFESNVL